jgi:polyketide cyclase/dehydrase/lipid transport protein
MDSLMLLRPRLLSEAGFDHEIFVPVPPEAVLARLSQPDGWIRLQPLVIAVEEEPRAPGMLRVTDRLEMWGHSFHLRYRARVSPVPGGIDAHAWSFPFIHVFNRLRCRAEGGGTVLRETSIIEAPRPLLGYAVKTAQAAHATMLANLRDALVKESDAPAEACTVRSPTSAVERYTE